MEETEEPDHLADGAPEPRPDVRLLRSITLRNILSFGPDTPPLELRALNVLIGPNGSGKSNLLTAVELLKESANTLDLGLTMGDDLVWKGAKNRTGTVKAVVQLPHSDLTLGHELEVEELGPVTVRVREYIARQPEPSEAPDLVPYFDSKGKEVRLRNKVVPATMLNSDSSVLVQFRDPLQYPELTALGEAYLGIRLFRDWGFGNYNSARRPQRTDVRNDFPSADGANLGLTLNKLRRNSVVKKQLLDVLNELYEGITDFGVDIEGGYAHLYLQEGKFEIPGTRLSDGTLRFLFLLAVLLHPTPPPLICLEEPELGLHPDVIVTLGKLIKEASTRTQLIVTTHSRILIDTFQDSPEDVVVVSKEDGATQMERLDPNKLRAYLDKYSLSNLWSSGDIGGNRW